MLKLTLIRLLKYQNQHVVDRYIKDYKVSKTKAKEIFQEMLKFLWLSHQAHLENKQRQVPMYPEMTNIDNMWHTFILFTRDYALFCKKYFGYFHHHAPNVSNRQPTKRNFFIEFEDFLIFTKKHLGEETLKKWFIVYFEPTSKSTIKIKQH